jgi:hypothetical protein
MQALQPRRLVRLNFGRYAIADFSMAYADQNEKDHAALARAVRSRKVKAEFEQAA